MKKPPTSRRAYEIMRMMWCVNDVMRQEPEQCFTVDILLNVSVRLKIMVSNRSAVCRTYEIMRIKRMHSPTQDCATRKPTLLYYSCCFDFVCSTSPGGNLPQSLWTYPTAWHTAYPTIPRTYPKSKSPRHTGPHGQVFWLVSYFPKGFGTFCINLWMLYLRPKCQSTHGTPWNDFLTVQARGCNSHCRNNIINLETCSPCCFPHWHTNTSKHSGNSLPHNPQNLCYR